MTAASTPPPTHGPRRSSRITSAPAIARVAPAILQPAEPFLDLSGEDIRRRMFLTTDPDGSELCLRPDLTIPVSRDYLASAEAGEAAGFCYLGPVFRHRGEAPAEFVQAGIESFGRRDTAAADAEMLALGLEATAHYGIAAPEIRMGDVGLFAALVARARSRAGLEAAAGEGLQPRRQRSRTISTSSSAQAAHERPEYQGVLAALAGSDPKAAHALVTDLLSIAGINAVGGRTRRRDRGPLPRTGGARRKLRPAARDARADRTVPRHRAAIRTRPPTRCARSRRKPSSTLPPRSTCSRAAPASSPRAASTSRASSFSTAFGRGLDYYTGFVFELHDPATARRRASSSPAAAMTGC